jgi:hypothetical protein
VQKTYGPNRKVFNAGSCDELYHDYNYFRRFEWVRMHPRTDDLVILLDLELRGGFLMLDFVYTATNPFEIDFHHVAIFEP